MKFQLLSVLDSLNRAEQIIDEFFKENSLNEELFGNVLVAVTEGLNNAISHGNKLDSALTVDFSIEMNEQGLIEIIIEDQGNGFDFNNLPDPTSLENLDKPTGRGIFLMKGLSDECEFLNDGRTVKLLFQTV